MVDRSRFKNSALVLAAHGSHLNPNSSAPCHAVAEAIRQRGLFGEVQACFWKEEPHFRHVCDMIEAWEIFAVPFFISDGYFTETVLPRELGVRPPRSRVGEKTVHYCQPVGTHEAMTRVILHRAKTVVQSGTRTPPSPSRTALCIAGHGTNRNENSAKSILRQIEWIRKLNRYAEVRAIFMDQTPEIEKCYELTKSPHLVVVPFFISDGFHTREDIPGMLGLQRGRTGACRVPSRVRGRHVWYAGAVGTDPTMAEVVLERAAQAAST